MLRLFLVLLILLWGSSDAKAHIIEKENEIVRLVSSQYPPYVFQEDGEIKGLSVDLVREIARRSNVAIEIEVMPWARSLNAVKYGLAHGIFALFKTSQRQDFLEFMDEGLIKQDIALFIRNEGAVRQISDLVQKSHWQVGARRAVNYGPWFSQALLEKTWKDVSYANSDESLLHKLHSARIDILPMNRHVAYYHMEKLGYLGHLREIRPMIARLDSFIAFSTILNAPWINARFCQSLRQMKQDGTYDKIIHYWLDGPSLDIAKIVKVD